MTFDQNFAEKSLNRVVFKLRFYREAANLSQKETAEKLNIGHRSYQRIENGEANCDILLLYRFSKVFDVNLVELVTPYSPKKPKNFSLFDMNQIEEFEKNPFVQLTNFKNLTHQFENKILDLLDGKDLLSSDYPLMIWTPSKKVINDVLLEIYDIKKIYKKDNFLNLPIDEKMNILDCLFYYRPKYSIKKISNVVIKEKNYEIEFYSTHLYQEDEILTLSLLKLIPSAG